MSFLKILGKKGAEPKSEDLDLPPLPPPLKGPEGDLGLEPLEGGAVPKVDDLPPLPMPGDDIPAPDLGEVPAFPEMPPLEETPPIADEIPMPEIAPEIEAPPEQIDLPPEEPQINIDSDKPTFIKIEKYRSILKEINKIKGDFEKSRNTLTGMEEIKAKEDKEFESWKYGLEDIRKKLTFIDQNLYGD